MSRSKLDSSSSNASPRRILFMLSGSIAGFKAAQVISRLVQTGDEVQVAVTPSALQFIGPATLEGLTGRPIASDTFAPGQQMDHIHLARWADIAILCPASANTMAKLATGMADDFVSTVTLAWEPSKPFLIAPAMNQQMWAAAVTQENVKRLAERGFRILGTQSGALACGEFGEGRMLEVEEILAAIGEAFQPARELKKLGRILLTAGATREPIDGIRFLSNVSTGQTGARLCDILHAEGWDVTYLSGTGAAEPQFATQRLRFETFEDLNSTLENELATHAYAGVIHCAAVSDYSVAEVRSLGKKSSPRTNVKLKTEGELALKLKANFKILPRLKTYSINPDICIVGFKLGLNFSQKETTEAVSQLLTNKKSVDAVVANDWTDVKKNREARPCTLFTAGGERYPTQNLTQLGQLLSQFVRSHYDSMSRRGQHPNLRRRVRRRQNPSALPPQ